MTLLEKVASFENLVLAYNECSRRKRFSMGYQKTRFNLNETLVDVGERLLAGEYRWGPYREFYVCDPKRRLIMAAPFMCRVIHHAIHRVIESILDPCLSDSVFACRWGRGNRFAAQTMMRRLALIGPDRYVLKLDVSQYFPSISHELLMEKLMACFPDDSLRPLLRSLLESHPVYAKAGRGIPIGNLTSQLFANFYLNDADRVACHALGTPFYWLDESKLSPDAFFIRYMDDLVLMAKDKRRACEAAERVVAEVQEGLDLKIPMRKRMHIAADPVPFLGYVMDHEGFRPLARNRRKITKKLRRLEKRGERPSLIAQVRLSYEAWLNLMNEEEGGRDFPR